MTRKEYRILFVCLGNICRSPLAAAIFRKLLEEHGLEASVRVDSCGTGAWHIGQPAHEQTAKTALKAGISLHEHRARQLEEEDFERFDLIVAMDRSNYRDICALGNSGSKQGEQQVVHLRDFDSESAGDLDVPDPFYGGAAGFQRTQDIIWRSARELLHEIEKRVASGGRQ